MRLSATINTTNRQVDIRLNEIEQRLVEDESSPEESIEEEERNQLRSRGGGVGGAGAAPTDRQSVRKLGEANID